MTERQIQFRVGLMVLAAFSVGITLLVRFSKLDQQWQNRYPLVVQFETASGIYRSAPVILHGISIGNVQEIGLDPTHRGVVVVVQIKAEHRLREGSRFRVSRSLLGESVVEVVPGEGTVFIKPNERLRGDTAMDPLELVHRLEERTVRTLDAFHATSSEWQQLAKNMNQLLETKQGSLTMIVERTAESLKQFSLTMESVNHLVQDSRSVLADPASQRALKETLTLLPEMVRETKQTVAITRQTLASLDRNLTNLNGLTEPLGQRGDKLVAKIDSSLQNFDSLLREMNRFVQLVNREDGSLQKFITEPALYNNLDKSSQSLSVLLRNLEPIVLDLREFSDKIARRPELLGVGGSIRPSSGLKDDEILKPVPTETTRPKFPPPLQLPGTQPGNPVPREATAPRR